MSREPMGRAKRVGEALRTEISALLLRDVKDPRVVNAFPSVTCVDLNRDLTLARVGVSFITTDSNAIESALAGLSKAAGFLRGPAARRINLSKAPELRFFHDTTAEMSNRIHDIVRDDESRRAAADQQDAALQDEDTLIDRPSVEASGEESREVVADVVEPAGDENHEKKSGEEQS